MFILLAVYASSGPVSAEPDGAMLTGTITLQGPIPPSHQVTVNRDAEFCGTTVELQTVTVAASSGGLLNAVVSISGLEGQTPGAPQLATVIKNRKCAFIPRISTAKVENSLEIGNDDPVLHNTHIRNGTRTVLNVAMVPHGRNVRKPVKEPGLLKVQCDAHKFMEGYILAFDHPFFSITDENGRFRIAGIPPGTHQIIVWHETLGTLKKEVVIPDRGEISVHISYPPGSGS